MDAAAHSAHLGFPRGWRVDEGAVAYGEIVWSWPPDAEVKPAGDPQVTGANKPGPRGEYV